MFLKFLKLVCNLYLKTNSLKITFQNCFQAFCTDKNSFMQIKVQNWYKKDTFRREFSILCLKMFFSFRLIFLHVS